MQDFVNQHDDEMFPILTRGSHQHARTDEVRPPDIDVIMLDDALTQLAAFDERKSRIAELRFFGGLSLEEMAQVLDISVATVERDWQAARAWLFATMKGKKVHKKPTTRE